MIEPKVAKLRQMMNDIKMCTALVRTDLVGFCEKWNRMQQEEIETEVRPLMDTFNKCVVDQKRLVDRLELVLTTHKIKIGPTLSQDWIDVNVFSDVVAVRKIDMEQLLTCFAAIIPQIETAMFEMEYPDTYQLAAKAKFLSSISKRLDSVIVRLGPINGDAINQTIATNDVDPMFMQFSSLSARIKSMLMNTPTFADPRSRLTAPFKRPRIFVTAPDEPYPAIEYLNGTPNMSMEHEAAMQPSPKRFHACDSTTDSVASVTLMWKKTKTKTSAIELLKNIQTRNVVEPPKKGRQSMFSRSFMQSTLISDCNNVRVKAFEPNPRIPFTADSSNQISIVVGARDSPTVSVAAMPKNTRIQKRLSLDGN